MAWQSVAGIKENHWKSIHIFRTLVIHLLVNSLKKNIMNGIPNESSIKSPSLNTIPLVHFKCSLPPHGLFIEVHSKNAAIFLTVERKALCSMLVYKQDPSANWWPTKRRASKMTPAKNTKQRTNCRFRQKQTTRNRFKIDNENSHQWTKTTLIQPSTAMHQHPPVTRACCPS